MATISMKSKPKSEKNINGKGNLAKSTDANCVIATGTHIEGDFSSTENVRLDGMLRGTLKCDHRLVIGEKGRVEGEVSAAEAVIMGQITGNLTVAGSLQLKSTAKIDGDITAKYLVVEEGAAYNGQCKVGN